MEKAMSFNNIQNGRKRFVSNNKDKDHVVLHGSNKIIISAPHGVSQVRLGKQKFSEIGSLATALYLQEKTDCFLVAKTRNNNDDANFDEVSLFKSSIRNLVKKHNIKYVIDFHGLSAKRDCDINLGTHLGNNISSDLKVFNKLNDMLIADGYKVSVDQPFMAGRRTISGSIKNEFPEVFTLQIEINCSITNKKENFGKYKRLLTILSEWLEHIKTNC